MSRLRRGVAKRRKREKREIRRLAYLNISNLFEQAILEPNEAKKKQFIQKALRTSRSTRTPIPDRYRTFFCRKCGSSWFGETRRVRMRGSNKSRRRHQVITCLVCGFIYRRALSRERV